MELPEEYDATSQRASEGNRPSQITIMSGQVASIGDHNTVNVAMTPRPVDWPAVIGAPPPVAQAYQPRNIAGMISSGIFSPEPQDDNARFNLALTGSGGVGKSQIASYAFHNSRDELRVWVPASSRAAVEATYRATAQRLGIAPDDVDVTHAARALLSFLQETRRNWLIVLDDLLDPSHLVGLWPPSSGRVIITTRRRDAQLAAGGREIFDLSEFTPLEASNYITSKLTPPIARGLLPSGVSEQAPELADALGNLPLALAQATGVIIDDALTCGDYLTRFHNERETLEALLPVDSRPDEYSSTLQSALKVSLDSADRFPPSGLASRMANVVAYLDPGGFPEALLLSQPVRAHLGGDPERHNEDSETSAAFETVEISSDEDASHQDAHPDDCRRALRSLHRVSVLSHVPDGQPRSVRMHSLTGRSLRESGDDSTEDCCLAIASALLEIWPTVESDAQLSLALRENAIAITGQFPYCLVELVGLHEVFVRCARSFFAARQPEAALDFLVDVFTRCTEYVHAQHPSLFGIRSHIGTALGESGDYEEAVSVFEELVNDREDYLGPDHPDSLRSRSNLAFWRRHLGDEGILSQYEDVLARRTAVLGATHPETLLALVNVADLGGNSVAGATRLEKLEGVCGTVTASLGDQHKVSALATKLYLRRLFDAELLDADRGEPALRKLVDDHIAVFGPDHPETLSSRDLLLKYLGYQRSPRALQETNVHLQQLVQLGISGPQILSVRIARAQLLTEAGRASEALAELEHIEFEHASELAANTGAAIAFHFIRGTSHAEQLSWRAAADDLKIAVELHENRPSGVANTWDLLLGLASCYEELEDWNESVPVLQKLLECEIERDEGQSRQTFVTRNSLAVATGRGGNPSAARDQLEGLLGDIRDSNEFLSEEELLVVELNYANMLRLCQQTTQALGLVEELIPRGVELLGHQSQYVQEIESLRSELERALDSSNDSLI